MIRKQRLAIIAALLFTFLISPVQAGQPAVWETSGRTELLKGDARGVSISDTGVLMLAPKLNEVFNTQKAYVYFDPGDKYIWSLAVMTDGSLAVATGDSGKLYRVRAAGATPESSLLVSTNQTHVISLAVTPQGDLIAGTDSGGLVLRVSPEGKMFALFDTSLREIHALAPAADGSIYALALSDAAASGRATTTPQVTTTPQPAEGTATTTVTITPIDKRGEAIRGKAGQSRSRNDV